jgi:hypothetical protein
MTRLPRDPAAGAADAAGSAKSVFAFGTSDPPTATTHGRGRRNVVTSTGGSGQGQRVDRAATPRTVVTSDGCLPVDGPSPAPAVAAVTAAAAAASSTLEPQQSPSDPRLTSTSSAAAAGRPPPPSAAVTPASPFLSSLLPPRPPAVPQTADDVPIEAVGRAGRTQPPPTTTTEPPGTLDGHQHPPIPTTAQAQPPPPPSVAGDVAMAPAPVPCASAAAAAIPRSTASPPPGQLTLHDLAPPITRTRARRTVHLPLVGGHEAQGRRCTWRSAQSVHVHH